MKKYLIIPATEGPYNHEEILEILSTEEWTAPMGEMV